MTTTGFVLAGTALPDFELGSFSCQIEKVSATHQLLNGNDVNDVFPPHFVWSFTVVNCSATLANTLAGYWSAGGTRTFVDPRPAALGGGSRSVKMMSFSIDEPKQGYYDITIGLREVI